MISIILITCTDIYHAMSWLDLTWYNVTYFHSLCEVMWCDVICKYALNYFLHYLYCINFFFIFLPYLAAAHLTLSYLFLSYRTLSYPILSYPILSYPILPYPILSYPILPSLIESCSFYFVSFTFSIRFADADFHVYHIIFFSFNLKRI